MEKHAKAFRKEAHDILSKTESLVLQLGDSPGNGLIIDRISKSFHTIRITCLEFGFVDISSLAHDIEVVFDKVRAGAVQVTPKLVGLTIAAQDNILEQVDNYSDTLDNDSRWVSSELQSLLHNYVSNERTGYYHLN